MTTPQVNELLEYFRQAIEHPETVRPWNYWWIENSDRVESAFPREDFLRLKYRKLRGAWTVLEKSGKERILKNKIIVKNGKVKIVSSFSIALADYNITIPRIVHKKIAEEIDISLEIIQSL